MKVLYNKQVWDAHISYKITLLDLKENKIAGEVTLEVNKDACHILSLYVYPEYLKKGYGNKLLKEALFIYKHYGELKDLYIKVNKEKEQLINWYKKNDFRYLSDADEAYIWMEYHKCHMKPVAGFEKDGTIIWSK